MSFAILVGASGTLVLAAGIALNSGIVWYERKLPEKRRTLVNRLISNHSLVVIAILMVMCPAVIAMAIFESLPTVVCNGTVLLGSLLIFIYFISADIIITLRYLFKVRFLAVTPFNEELVYFFISLMTFVLPFYFTILKQFFFGFDIPLRTRCLGMDMQGPDRPTANQNTKVVQARLPLPPREKLLAPSDHLHRTVLERQGMGQPPPEQCCGQGVARQTFMEFPKIPDYFSDKLRQPKG